MSKNYEKENMLRGLTETTFKDLMVFSGMVADGLANEGIETISPHVMAAALSGVAQFLIDEEAEKKTELKRTQKQELK